MPEPAGEKARSRRNNLVILSMQDVRLRLEEVVSGSPHNKNRPQGSERGIKYGEAGYSPAAKIPTPYALQASLQICGRGMRTSSTCALHKCLVRKWSFLIITKNRPQGSVSCYGGGSWIRTSEVSDNRFTVCPLWPLGNSPIKYGAGERSRTINLLITNQLLCH